MLGILGAAGLMMCATSVHAQVHPDVKSGKVLASKLCVSCHIVGPEASSATVAADVPSFATIANKRGHSAQAIAGAIVIPHPPIPQIQLTREEIGDLAAYINRSQGAGGPVPHIPSQRSTGDRAGPPQHPVREVRRPQVHRGGVHQGHVGHPTLG